MAASLEPDLILLRLDGRDGIEACQQLRNVPETRRLRVLLVLDRALLSEARMVGANAVVMQPVSSLLLAIEVKRVLQLGAPTVRQEFGKALDLNVRSYCLLTYNPIRPKISAGANKFGLDVAALFIARGMTPEQLVSHVCEKLEKSRKEERFPAGLKTRYEEYEHQQISFNP